MAVDLEPLEVPALLFPVPRPATFIMGKQGDTYCQLLTHTDRVFCHMGLCIVNEEPC